MCLHDDHPQAGPLASSLGQVQEQQLLAEPVVPGDWQTASAAIRGLFSRRAERRTQASRLLRRALYPGSPTPEAQEGPHTSEDCQGRWTFSA